MVQRVEGVQVRRIGDGHGHFVVRFEQRDDAVFFGDIAWDNRDDVVLNLHVGEVHHLRAELRGLGLRHVAGPDGLVRHEKIHHAHAGGDGLFARLADHVSTGEAEVNQQVQ